MWKPREPWERTSYVVGTNVQSIEINNEQYVQLIPHYKPIIPIIIDFINSFIEDKHYNIIIIITSLRRPTLIHSGHLSIWSSPASSPAIIVLDSFCSVQFTKDMHEKLRAVTFPRRGSFGLVQPPSFYVS